MVDASREWNTRTRKSLGTWKRSRGGPGIATARWLGAVTKKPIHLFLFRYGSLCRFGMSPLNLFCDNGLGSGRGDG